MKKSVVNPEPRYDEVFFRGMQELFGEGERSMQTFKSGAIRDSDDDKLDYEGFLSPLILRRYAEYLHKHRNLPDGSTRSSDNWQKGMPRSKYIKSLLRHVFDVWLHHRGLSEFAVETLEDSLYGALFNLTGYALENEKAKLGRETPEEVIEG